MNTSRNPRSFTALCALALIGAAAFTQPPAEAQVQIEVATSDYHFGGAGASYTPEVTASKLKRYVRVLGLGEDMATIVEDMHHTYTTTLRSEAEGYREQARDLRDEATATQDWSIFAEQMAPLMKEWSERKKELDEGFLRELKSVLSPEQLTRWPMLERDRRRSKMLPDARLPGEDVDFVTILDPVREELKDSAVRARLDELLEAYMIELDDALTSRQKALETMREEFRQAQMSGDRERAKEIWSDATRKRESVRSINTHLLAVVKGVLDQETAAAVERQYLERAYPVAFEPTRAEKYVEKALELDSLTEDQHAVIGSRQDQLLSDLQPIRERLMEAIDEQAAKLPYWMQAMQVSEDENGVFAFTIDNMNDEDEDDPFRDALRERFDLSRRTQKGVSEVLTQAQRDQIPRVEVGNAHSFRAQRLGGFEL